MGLKLKDGIDKEVLRKYGFKSPKEFEHERWYNKYIPNEHFCKFLMDEENPDCIAYTDDDYDIPMVSMYFRFGEEFIGDLYINCCPSCTYHISGGDLNVVTDTIFELVEDGIVELY